MTLTRRQVLTIGPVVLVAACYALAAPSSRSSVHARAAITNDEASDGAATAQPLAARCQSAASQLLSRLGSDWCVIVREPFVLGGDLSEDELEDHYQRTVMPMSRALAASYFSAAPRHPIVILICSSDERFDQCNIRLGDQPRHQYAGIYSRKQRRIIINTASSDGSLAHELTHALAHADFPQMPEWFDEGLASLHEDCELSSDGLHLIGRANWRREIAFEALQKGELRVLEDVASQRFGSRDRAQVDYACVRSLCLYLQERGLLKAFYRTCRSNSSSDPTGLRSLCQVTNEPSPKTLDDAFRAWLLKQ